MPGNKPYAPSITNPVMVFVARDVISSALNDRIKWAARGPLEECPRVCSSLRAAGPGEGVRAGSGGRGRARRLLLGPAGDGLVPQDEGRPVPRGAPHVLYNTRGISNWKRPGFGPWLVVASVYYATPFVYVWNSGLGP
eukprot:1179756-Prorocentrum_minimum.AAC.1